jgi:hypothetical protein
MKFSLLKRSLGGITQVNLSGIRPQHEATVALGDGKDYRDRSHTLPLPLKEEGAYLVVCRGDDLYAGGLVLLTPLAVDVQEDAVSGRVRTTVKDRTTDKCLYDVQVKVIGSLNEDFVSGQSDLRGVFVADGIRGAATVIAQAGPSRYAFYRTKGAATEDAIGRLIAVRQPSPPAPSGAARPGTTGVLLLGGSDSEKILKALDSPTQIDAKEMPLQDVVAHLKKYHGIEIQIDRKSLDDAGIQPDAPITRNVRGIALKSALRMILGDLGLTYLAQNDVIHITTPEAAESQDAMETKVYPVADLVLPPNPPAGKEVDADFDSLVELLMSTIKPDSWSSAGGPAPDPFPFEKGLCLVITQTQEVHEMIEAVLAKIRGVVRDTGRKGLPTVKHRPKKPADGMGMGGGMGGMPAGNMGGMMGGMGGMPAGNMGGMMGGMPAADGGKGSATLGKASVPPAVSQQPDLLQGVQEINKGFQGKQSEKLQKIYSGGKGGVGAGVF